MQITILAAGSQGDVQPYLALAVGLKNEGYSVRFAANSNFASLGARYDLDFFPIQVDSFEIIHNPRARAWLDSDSAIQLALRTIRAVRPVVHQLLVDSLHACKGSHLIIYNSYALPFVYYFGRYLEIPCIPATLHPVPTRSYPAILSNIHYSPSKTFNLFTHLVVNQISWQVFLPELRKFWRGKEHISFIGPFKKIMDEQFPILCGYSPTVIPEAIDLPGNVVLCGYWFLKPNPGWMPDPGLTNFIQSGRRPLYIGFGSMGSLKNNQATTDIIVKALAETGQRAVLAAGWSGLGVGQQLPDNIFPIKDIPHQWLFPQMAAIVHHGGIGTTGAGLSAGVPNIVISHFGDQNYWGRRIAELGAGPHPITRKKLSQERLAQAISMAIHDQAMKHNAEIIGAKILAEEGIQKVIQAIQPYIN
ncbi:MAG TPA: glycosyltransferase [Anaerolineales bacterium]|nr:glycosyltransferase [Anaerolineales bacterium]